MLPICRRAFAVGCAGTLTLGAACASPTTQHQQETTYLLLQDDFEGGSLASFWAPGDYGAGRYVEGAVRLTERFAHTGQSSVQVTVRLGDIEQDGGDGVRSERAELDSGKHELLGRQVNYRFAVLVPADFPIVDTRLVIAQWKQDGVSGSPLIAQRFRSGRHTLTIRPPDGEPDERREFVLPPLTAGIWHELEYDISFTTGALGFVHVTMDRERVATYSGPTAFQDGTERFYNKFGLYRDAWPEPMTIYFDSYRLAGVR